MLAQRVATAAVGLPLLLLLVLLGGWPYAVMVALALGVAAWELTRLWQPRSGGDANTILYAAALPLAAHHDEAWMPWALVVLVALAMMFTIAYPLPPRRGYAGLMRMLGGIAYIGLLGATFVLLRDLDNGRDWVLLALLGTFAADTFAYFTGRAFGRHRMAPAISPNKTWEGFGGGWLGGIAAVLGANWLLGLREDAAIIVPLAVLLPVAATLGDLFESWLKRRAGAKDASNLVPGHGGVLDRIDSLLFAVPLVWLFARWPA